jgi:hypothetical protein
METTKEMMQSMRGEAVIHTFYLSGTVQDKKKLRPMGWTKPGWYTGSLEFGMIEGPFKTREAAIKFFLRALVEP